MISPRRAKIVNLATGIVGGALVASGLAYLFASDSPSAVPLLCHVLGNLLGILLVYFTTRAVEPRALAGRLMLGGMLVAACLCGYAMYKAFPYVGTVSESFVKGLGLGLGFSAFVAVFRLISPIDRVESR